jgi:hypothetical protein
MVVGRLWQVDADISISGFLSQGCVDAGVLVELVAAGGI